jgi:hypothetical protein
LSLIDDALKRAREADEKRDGAPRERPWVPAPLPDPAIARRRRLWRGLMLAAIGGAVLAGGFVLFRRTAEPKPGAVTEQGQGRPGSPPTAVLASPTLVAVEVPPPPAAPRPTRPARSAPNEAVAEATAGETEARPAPPPAAPRERVYSRSVTLPGGEKIELGGIVWSEADPRALVNDRVVGVGSYVEGYTVTKIEEDRITLERDGAGLVVSLK